MKKILFSIMLCIAGCMCANAQEVVAQTAVDKAKAAVSKMLTAAQNKDIDAFAAGMSAVTDAFRAVKSAEEFAAVGEALNAVQSDDSIETFMNEFGANASEEDKMKLVKPATEMMKVVTEIGKQYMDEAAGELEEAGKALDEMEKQGK